MTSRIFVMNDLLYNSDGDIVEETKINITKTKDNLKGEIYKKDREQESLKTMNTEDCQFYLNNKTEGYWQYVIPSRIYTK